MSARLNDRQILEILAQAGALIRESHIVYTSGRHGNAYVNKDALYPHTKLTSQLCREMAERFADVGVEVVLAPAIGGVILSQWVAHHLSDILGREVLAIYAEKGPDDATFLIRRGYDRLAHGRKVLVLEDVLTTGSSVKKVINTLRTIPAEIIGVAALCNRGGVRCENLGNVPRLESLVEINLDSWEESDCPLCKAKVPVNMEVGKGREYLARKGHLTG